MVVTMKMIVVVMAARFGHLPLFNYNYVMINTPGHLKGPVTQDSGHKTGKRDLPHVFQYPPSREGLPDFILTQYWPQIPRKNIHIIVSVKIMLNHMSMVSSEAPLLLGGTRQ